jgi:glycerol kinase
MENSPAYVLSLDQGTTSSRAIVFGGQARALGLGQIELPQIYPRPGWVEHDPERIFQDTIAAAKTALAQARIEPGALAAIGITNQRETIVVWDAATGKAIGNAIVWQDRRTSEACATLAAQGHETMVNARTGLVLDPYFSGTKLKAALDTIPDGHARASRREILAGTVDSWLLYRLTGGKVHATDATNASRTMLFDIKAQQWSAELCDLLGVPMAMLPIVKDSAADFGLTDPGIFGAAVRITGIAGDQQAALVGQSCLSPGMIKATYGTGCFVLLNIGQTAAASTHRLLTTIAYQLDGVATYALEGSIFVAGAAVQWLRDGLGLIKSAAEVGALAAKARPDSEVYMVPAFTGLGAPHWDAHARGALIGLTRDTGAAEIARATLDAVAYQTRDLIEAMGADLRAFGAAELTRIRVDGGMTASDPTMQSIADMTGLTVERPNFTETTAFGAAMLAGMYAGAWGSLAEQAQAWALERRFSPSMDENLRAQRYAGWIQAVGRVRTI